MWDFLKTVSRPESLINKVNWAGQNINLEHVQTNINLGDTDF